MFWINIGHIERGYVSYSGKPNPLLEKDTGVDFRKSMSVFLFAVDKAYFYAQNQIFG